MPWEHNVNAGRDRKLSRRRLALRHEFTLAVLPTATVLLVLALTELFSKQRLLFASLASSAFLVYLDPAHPANAVSTLLATQVTAALTGTAVQAFFGPGYGAAAALAVLQRRATAFFAHRYRPLSQRQEPSVTGP